MEKVVDSRLRFPWRNLVIILLIGIMGFIFALPEYSYGELKGLMFLDYYYVAQQHQKNIQGQHGFWFRRIYLTYDTNLTAKFRMRFRVEMNSAGDFKTKSKLSPSVKDAYLSYQTSRHELKLGIIPTPTWNNIETYWGYRALEKTIIALQKFGAVRDFGISLQGTLDRNQKISYMVMFGNGESINSEINKGKKIYGQLGFKPVQRLYVEFYGDYEKQKDNRTYAVYQIFGGYQASWGRAGLQFARRFFKQNSSTDNWNVFSAFAVIKASESMDIIARYDRVFQPNPKGEEISYIPFSNLASSHLIIGGISWQAARNIWFIPNLKYVFYGMPDKEDKPDSDIYFNLTVFFKF